MFVSKIIQTQHGYYNVKFTQWNLIIYVIISQKKSLH